MAKFLSKEQELEYGYQVQAMLKAEERKKTKDLTVEESVEVDRVIALGRNAVDVLASNYTRMVWQKAKMYKASYPSLDPEDVVQEGMVGLMKAIYHYDPSRGNKLSTVASYWIYQSIARNTNSTGRLVRLPENRAYELNKINHLRNDFEAQGVDSSKIDDMIRCELSLSEEDYIAIINAGSVHASLNARVSGTSDKSDELINYVHLDHSPSAESVCLESYQSEILVNEVEKLDNVQRDVVKSAFNMDTSSGVALSRNEVRKLHRLSNDSFNSKLNDSLAYLRHVIGE